MLTIPKFVKATSISFEKLKTKDPNKLYFIEDTKEIYKGSILYSKDIKFVESLPEKGEEKIIYITKDNKINIWVKNETTLEGSSTQITFKWQILNPFETILEDNKVIEVPVTGEAIKKYVQYKFDHAPITVDASNIKYDNTKVKKTELTNMQEVLDQVFTISDSIRKSFATTIGIDENQTFDQMASEFIDYKSQFANILRNKGIPTASSTEPLIVLINKVKNISNINILNNTKLNVKAGTVKEIQLKDPITVDNLCVSLIKYIPGEQGKERYSCHFDNTDSVNFIPTDSIEYKDGAMQQKIKTEKITCTPETLTDGTNIHTVTLDKSQFYKICNLEVDSDDTNTYLNITGSFKPTVVFTDKDIDLTNVYEITKINWKANVGNNNKLLILFSTNQGKTYKSYYNNQVVTVDHTNMTEVSEKGMTQNTLASLTNSQLEELRNNSRTIRFAYYFEINNTEQKCVNDDITMIVDMKGTNEIPGNSEYTYKLSDDCTKIIITFNKEGTYTIVWADDKTEVIV